MTRRRAFWLTFALAQALYLAIALWSLPRIASEAGGIPPFDMRPLGYSLAEAREFLAALTPEGRARYLGIQHWLDTAYPAVLGLMLALGMALLFRGWTLRLLLVIALGVTGFDYLENHAVAAMLEAGPEALDAATVAVASSWTLLKSVCTSLGYLALLVGLGRYLWTRRKVPR